MKLRNNGRIRTHDELWGEFPKEGEVICEKLADSMPRRIEASLKLKVDLRNIDCIFSCCIHLL